MTRKQRYLSAFAQQTVRRQNQDIRHSLSFVLRKFREQRLITVDVQVDIQRGGK